MMYVCHTNRKVTVDYCTTRFQPCWTCKKACGGCSWSRDFEPVKGWTAEKSFHVSNREHAETYKIIECPEYECDRRYGSNK